MKPVYIDTIKDNLDFFLRNFIIPDDIIFNHSGYSDDFFHSPHLKLFLLNPQCDVMPWCEITLDKPDYVIQPVVDRCKFLSEVCFLHTTVRIEHIHRKAFHNFMNNIEMISVDYPG
jgi:hypothetical protein